MTFVVTSSALRRYQEQLSQLQAVIGQREMVQQAHGVNQFFNQHLWAVLTQSEQSHPQWQSATTEIHRHMRLLAVEISFAQSARHGQTRQQRLDQIEQRLQQLQGFTTVLIELCGDESASSGD